MMDTIRLEIEREDTPAWGFIDSVIIFVNGRNLLDLAKEAELPYATRDGNPELAGSYVGLPAEAVFLPSRRFLGNPAERYDDWEGRISVLGCGCGVVGCWPLQARIEATEDRVTWRDFRQPHRRRWSHAALGPFAFDRIAYEAELRARPG